MIKTQRRILFLLFSIFIGLLMAACGAVSPASTETLIPSATETATPTLPPPPEKTTPIPDPEEAVRAYLDAWKIDDYASMYNMLTTISQDAITASCGSNPPSVATLMSAARCPRRTVWSA